MPRVLVTRGAGFIGSHLVHRLLLEGSEVSAVDNLSSGNLSNLDESLRNNRFSFHRGDFAEPRYLSSELPNTDVAVHLAGLTGVPYSIVHPDMVTKVNVEGTLALLRACARYSVGRVIFASSAAVYGTQRPPCSKSSSPNPSLPTRHPRCPERPSSTRFTNQMGLDQ